MKTGNTRPETEDRNPTDSASMEPGHEDREYSGAEQPMRGLVSPQWSPVMKTGNTTPGTGLPVPRNRRLNGARS